MKFKLIKNNGAGPHSAVLTGFKKTKSRYVLTYMADDFFNGPIVDNMVNKMKNGSDIVVASRFIKGGIMKGEPTWEMMWLNFPIVLEIFHLDQEYMTTK